MHPAEPTGTGGRIDHSVILGLIPAGARVLDIGCGEGELLRRLRAEKEARGQGLELSQRGVNACVAAGLSVIQGDAERDLVLYPDDSFDWVILSRTIQATQRPGLILREIRRIAPRAIVSFPNFGHWRVRVSLLLEGRMPVTAALPSLWHETDNIHLCTLRDMLALIAATGLAVDEAIGLVAGRVQDRRRGEAGMPGSLNWRAEELVLALARKADKAGQNEGPDMTGF